MVISGNWPRAAKARVMLCIICFMLAGTPLSAQTTNRVTFDKDRITLLELFSEIEKQTGSVVMVNTAKTDRSQVVSLTKTSGSITEILDHTLPGIGQTYSVSGRYITVMPIENTQVSPVWQAAIGSGETISYSPQPTQVEFESDIDDYTRYNLAVVNTLQAVSVRYDTIRTQRQHDGIFRYPSQSLTPNNTKRSVRTPFSQDTPPLFAIKTNLAWWAAGGTPNLAAEIGLGKKTSLEISGGNNRWNLKGDFEDNKKLVHWVVKPEFRYWLCERFNGHFFGVHALYGKYNVGGYNIPQLFDKEYRYEGDAWGGGISYGYHWAFAKRWGAEFTAGFGVARLNYEKYDCAKCGGLVGDFRKTYFGPTSLGVKLVFVIK